VLNKLAVTVFNSDQDGQLNGAGLAELGRKPV